MPVTANRFDVQRLDARPFPHAPAHPVAVNRQWQGAMTFRHAPVMDEVRFGGEPPKKRGRWLTWLALGLLGAFGYQTYVNNIKPQPTAPPVLVNQAVPDVNNLMIPSAEDLRQKILEGRVKSIEMTVHEKMGYVWRVTLTNNMQQYFNPNPAQEGYKALTEAMKEKGVYPQIKDESQAGYVLLNMLLVIAPIALIGYLVLRAMKPAGGGSGGGGGLGGGFGLGGGMGPTDTISTTKLDDVAGIDEVVDEIRKRVINPIKNNTGKYPKGVLLSGPPGTGKTLIAKAIAGELNRPFYSVSGSQFVEMFVGVGAGRVRELFANARKQAPAVIFIDEIDAVGKKRGSSSGFGGNDERDQTLNQLLKEMDGFDSTSNVLVIAATNRVDTLDDALTRPGRFDKQYVINPPMTPEGRRDVLNVHLKKVKLDPDVDPLFVAKRMWTGTSGAEIKNIVEEAEFLAGDRGREAVSRQDFLDAIERVHMGLAKKDVAFTPEDKRRVAAHEGLGHAAVAWALGMPVQFITVVPRSMEGGTALGIMGIDPEGFPKYHQTREFIEKMACIIMGGRASEHALYGTMDQVSTGASDDWKKVNGLLKDAIEKSAMYPELFGQIAIGESESFGTDGASQELRAKAERTRNEMMTLLYAMTLEFVKAIPEDAKNKILATIEEKETINDPELIKQMFQTSGVTDWNALWKAATDPVREKYNASKNPVKP